jgi:hypothetical protein
MRLVDDDTVALGVYVLTAHGRPQSVGKIANFDGASGPRSARLALHVHPQSREAMRTAMAKHNLEGSGK